MAPQHAPNHPFARLHTHVGTFSTLATSSFQALPTSSSSSLSQTITSNFPTLETPVLTDITEPDLYFPQLPFLLNVFLPYLLFITSLVLAIAIVLGSAWWFFHYPSSWSRALAPAYVQSHNLNHQSGDEGLIEV